MIEVHTHATGAEIFDIIALMEPVLQDKPSEHVLMACIALAFAIINPDLEIDQLVTGIEKISREMSLFALDIDPDDPILKHIVPDALMN